MPIWKKSPRFRKKMKLVMKRLKGDGYITATNPCSCCGRPKYFVIPIDSFRASDDGRPLPPPEEELNIMCLNDHLERGEVLQYYLHWHGTKADFDQILRRLADIGACNPRPSAVLQ